jgi:hypothetical protein
MRPVRRANNLNTVVCWLSWNMGASISRKFSGPAQASKRIALPFTLFRTVYGDYLSLKYWSQWSRGLRHTSAAVRLLGLWVRIPQRAWIYVCCECCVLLGRGLCDEPITRPEESYRLWCVVVYDLETSWMMRPWPTGGCCAKNKTQNMCWKHVFRIQALLT